MDRVKEASIIISSINKYKNGELLEFELTEQICDYFDLIKYSDLSFSDMKFLKYISSLIGIPHYYDLLLEKFQGIDKDFNEFNLNTFASLFYESSLYIDEQIKLHKHQNTILQKFNPSQLNRIFLSASTSFGKTYLVYEIIKKMKYKNIVLMFPTIALLSENLEKLKVDNYYQYFRENYKIHTLSQIEEDDLAQNNIFIFTPERFLSFLDKSNLDFDFIFMDEIYKIDNEYIIDNEEAKENERDTAYRVALYNALNYMSDMLLVGPYISVSNAYDENYNPSFINFLNESDFELIDYNDYQIVNKHRELFSSSIKLNKKEKLKQVLTPIIQNFDNCIIYCRGAGTAEGRAKEILLHEHINSSVYELEVKNLINHINSKFNSNWIVSKALEKGIGIHHGLVPKYIQKEIINLFNKGIIKILFSTTTITEGVNTTAKNIIIFDSLKGNKSLKKFDAKNIEGRAGRFMHHYKGNVIIIDEKFFNIINSEDIGIKHKNYDENSPKDEIDYFITNDKYLNNENLSNKVDILEKIAERGIPLEILNTYKVISYTDKIKLFDIIDNLTYFENKSIKRLISYLNGEELKIDFDGFDLVVNKMLPIVHNQDLKNLIKRTKFSEFSNRRYSNITFLLNAYLKYGFRGLIDYKINNQGIEVDKAIQQSSKFIYNTLKYQLVKYLGVFNNLYKFWRSQYENKEDVAGIDKLLSKLEHNAFTKKGKLASDYGVPYKIVQYYDTLEKDYQDAMTIKEDFDNYENKSFSEFENIIKE
ncbi:helicase-related protein [Arcobacter sp. YIC-310]|uniref:helicase-related protein n=1 Tax=Arcobacter sp. YIC-310 TaxID=3376632 RepID=UPI003C250082